MPQVVPPLPYFFVGRETATDRIQKYLSDKHPVLSNELNKPETKTIWYSRDHLRKLMDELDYLGANGLRVYLGAYENTHPIAPGQLCLMMVPTKLVSGKNEDVITEDEPDFADREMMPKSEPEWKLNGAPVDNGKKPKDYNYGSPCPPVCNQENVFKFPN